MNNNTAPFSRAYQQIQLPSGQVLSGHDRSYLHPFVFGDDFTGGTLLDVGTYHGHFCMEAARRNAGRVVGIDPCAESLRVARQIAVGLPVEYIHGDFESWHFEEQFDVVLLLNVLHHMWDPVHVLRKAAKLAKKRVVIEFHSPRRKDFARKKAIALRQRIESLFGRAPELLHGNPFVMLGRSEEAQHTFLFTRESIQTIFEKHHACFEPLDLRPSSFKERSIAVAKKRQIEHLTIVAAATPALANRARQKLEGAPEQRAAPYLPKADHIVTPESCDTLPNGKIESVILEYSVSRPFLTALRMFSRDPVLTLLMAAKKVDVFTVTSSDSSKTDMLEDIRDSGALDRIFQDWKAYIAQFPYAHAVIED